MCTEDLRAAIAQHFYTYYALLRIIQIYCKLNVKIFIETQVHCGLHRHILDQNTIKYMTGSYLSVFLQNEQEQGALNAKVGCTFSVFFSSLVIKSE